MRSDGVLIKTRQIRRLNDSTAILGVREAMSYTSMMVVRSVGPMETIETFSNSWGSAMRVWNPMAQRYCGAQNAMMYLMMHEKEFWALVNDKRLRPFERLVFAWTFDRMICERDKASELADAMLEFAAAYPSEGVDHLPAIAAALRLHSQDDCIGFGFIQTSVSSDIWQVKGKCENSFHTDGDSSEYCPDCDNEKDNPVSYRMFDWSQDNDSHIHGMLFRDYATLQESEV